MQMVNCYNGLNWDWSKINNYNILQVIRDKIKKIFEIFKNKDV